MRDITSNDDGPIVVIDRIDGDWAVLHLGEHRFDFPVASLPRGAAEGWHLRLSWMRDEDAERRARDVLGQRLGRLTEDDDGGDFEL